MMPHSEPVVMLGWSSRIAPYKPCCSNPTGSNQGTNDYEASWSRKEHNLYTKQICTKHLLPSMAVTLLLKQESLSLGGSLNCIQAQLGLNQSWFLPIQILTAFRHSVAQQQQRLPRQGWRYITGNHHHMDDTTTHAIG